MNRFRKTNPNASSAADIGTTELGSGTGDDVSARPDISRSPGAPQHSPYTNWKEKLPEGPLYVSVVTLKAVGPGALITVSPPIVSVKPSSCPALKVSPSVTVTVPVILKIVLSRSSPAWLAPEMMVAPPE